jgi:hypothetical protein
MNAMFNHTDFDFRDLPGRKQKYDYGSGTSGLPLYSGHADINAADGDGVTNANKGWVIFKFTYDGSSQVTMIECRRGTWTGRVALFP